MCQNDGEGSDETDPDEYLFESDKSEYSSDRKE
jgi:hypothetical protein